MSFKRIIIRLVMLLLLWGSLFAMFNLTQGVHPWIRVAIGIGICALYTFAQMKLNKKMYGDYSGNGTMKNDVSDNKDNENN